MAVEFKLPDIGEGVAEGEITRWLVKEGDSIKEDQPMVEVMTDKATVEITSPVTGTVGKILAQEGAVVPVHSVIVHLERSNGAPAAKSASSPSKGSEGSASGKGEATPSAGRTVDFKLPDIGEGVAEGEVTKWLVKEGDAIAEDQPMVEVMTDKATVEITSPVAGRIGKILAAEGQVVPVHSVIVQLLAGGGQAASAKEQTSSAPAAPAAKASSPAGNSHATHAPAQQTHSANNGRVLAAPATRRLAREKGVELNAVQGSGPKGRITKDDLMSFLRDGSSQTAQKAGAATDSGAKTSAPSAPKTYAPGTVEVVPYRGMRKAIGDQMERSLFSAPHFTYVDEVDMSALYALRKETAALAADQGVKVTFLPFIMKALVSAIRRFPSANAELRKDEGQVLIKHDVHVGIATDSDRGLLVPVIRNVDQKSLLEIARDLSELSEKARAGKASREELSGSTITITSAGSIGGLFATPIINYPEVAILGVYQIKDKPVIKNGQIVPGKIGYLSLTLDHRVVDGATAAHFVNHMKRLLENPGLLLLEA
jgi:pyruvate dehydrogenase E2 component (dihydrolipoamide acetyltransferase)